MDDIFQPIVSISTTDTMMYAVGFVEFALSFGFALLWFICFSNYELQSNLARKAIIANAVGWLLLICLGLFFIPHERIGSYLDVYANLALTNIGFVMVLTGVCASIFASFPKTGAMLTLFFAVVFSAIGGKSIGDFLSPTPKHAQIEGLSFNETDKRLSSLSMGLANTDYQQSLLIELAKKLQQDGVLNGIDFSESDGIEPPIRMDLVQAPYTEQM